MRAFVACDRLCCRVVDIITPTIGRRAFERILASGDIDDRLDAVDNAIDAHPISVMADTRSVPASAHGFSFRRRMAFWRWTRSSRKVV